jgi:serine/threonine-protein kinase
LDDPLSGALLGGRYRLHTRVDSGGMGSVHRGVDERTGQPVAVKIIHEELARDATLRERFRREAMAAAALQNPFIAATTDFGVDDRGRAYLVMEYLSGKKLSHVIEAEAPLAENRVTFIAAQVLDALVATHAAGIVHRDLKPPNVLLVELAGLTDVVKLMDFGIAKLQESEAYQRLTATGQIVGTPAFMAPEQARGDQVDGRADLYALGVVMYGALAKRLPYDVGDHAQLLVAIQDWAPTPLPDVAPHVSLGLWRDVISPVLAKRREDRFQTAEQMRAALLPYLGSRAADVERVRAVVRPAEVTPELRASVPGPPPEGAGRVSAVSRPPSRRPVWLWALIAGALLFAVLFAAGAVFIGLELALGPR